MLLYLHAPVTAQRDDVVAEDGVLVGVELGGGHLGGGGHARGVSDTLSCKRRRRAATAY